MAADLEERLQKTGKWLYQLIEGESPTLFQKQFWIGKVLDWCMRDETFRVEMFRFIDVFPYPHPPRIGRSASPGILQPAGSETPVGSAMGSQVRFADLICGQNGG